MKKWLLMGLAAFSMFTTQFGYSDVNQPAQAPAATQGVEAKAIPSGDNVQHREGNFSRDGRHDGNYGRGYGYDQNYGGGNDGGNDGNCCPADHPCEDQPVGDCWCLMCHYEPCYYNDWKCCEDQKVCKKRCCRYVPQYYEVQKCRYVPQYYCETCCKQVPEYYDVEYCQPCKKWVCEKKCRYVCKYYYKHVCGDNNCATPCPTNCPQ